MKKNALSEGVNYLFRLSVITPNNPVSGNTIIDTDTAYTSSMTFCLIIIFVLLHLQLL